MQVSRPVPGSVVLHVRGEVDTLTAPELDAELDGHLDGATHSVVLDLTGVSFLASSGLAVLIKAAHAAAARGLQLALVAPGRAVMRPLEVTSTAEMFTIHDSLAAAQAAMHRDGAGSEG